MQVMYKKLQLFSTNIWSITAGSSRVITVWTTVLAYRTWADGHVGVINNIHRRTARPRISQQLFMTQANEATSKTNWPNLTPPQLATHKDIATKREYLSGWQIYRHANFHVDRCHRRRDICPRTHTKRHTITADDISDKTHTSVAFAG